MSELADPKRSWEYENGFYQTCEPARIGKLLAHFELFRRVVELPGALVECGVFKGASLARFAAFRELFGFAHSKRIVAFDTFREFPPGRLAGDRGFRDGFVAAAGESSLSIGQIRAMLEGKRCDTNVELVAGDICETVPRYVRRRPELRISLLNLDTDLYEPAVTILEHLYPRLVRGGILILDDYGTVEGETRAVDEYFADPARGRVRIQKLPFCMTPCYVVKE